MLRKLYNLNFLFSKSIWHLINTHVLSVSAKRRFWQFWDNLVRKFHLTIGKQYLIKHKKGIRYLLDINNLIDLRIASRGSFEDQQQHFFLELIRKSQSTFFCDIGANWGMYSLLVSSENSISNILSFEPDIKNRSQLHANIFLNQLHSKITVYDCALSSFTGTASFEGTEEESKKLQNRGTAKLSSSGKTSVEVKRLDDILDLNNERIAIKIDVEGNEIEALQGMESCLKNNVCVLQIEAFENTKDLLIELMSTHGYALIHSIGKDYYFSNSKN